MVEVLQMINSFKLHSVLLILSIFITSFLIIPEKAFADTVGESECFPAILMLRGSGEDPTSGEYSPKDSPGTQFINTNGYEGDTLGELLQAFVNKTDPDETVSKVRFIGIKYPALPIPPEPINLPDTDSDVSNASTAGAEAALNSILYSNYLLLYNDSYRDGAKMTLDVIEQDEKRGCNTQYMLMSYSQGVISARQAINLLNNETDKVISSYVVGDPFQKANGAFSNEQKSVANTSPHTYGLARNISHGLLAPDAVTPSVPDSLNASGFNLIKLLSSPGVAGVKNYMNEMNNADPVIYRNDESKGIFSRALCHLHDPTCSMNPILELDIEEHTNYFDPTSSPGTLDLEYEIAAFDKQVRTLANSANTNPRARALVQTPSISGQKTTYNIANARPDDICRWDKNSDGTVELEDTCDTRTVTHTSKPKMTVTVLDSFGSTHEFKTEVDAIDPTILDSALGLDSDAWYAFHPYKQGELAGYEVGSIQEQCLQVGQEFHKLIKPVNYTVLMSSCSVYSDPKLRELDAPTHMFKSVPYGTENRMLWGYDDDYTLTDGGAEEYDNGVYIMMTSIESLNYGKNQNIKPVLTTFINGKPYYSLRHKNRCYAGRFFPCNTNDLDQLFSVTKSERQFGSASAEKDVTPPTPVTGLHLSVTGDPKESKLKWELATDTRTDYIDYEIYQKDNDTNAFNLIGKVSDPYTHTNFYSIDTSDMALNTPYTFKVVGVDYGGNKSVPDVITVELPDFNTDPVTLIAGPPGTPYLLDLNYDDRDNPYIKLLFSNHADPVTRIRLYDYYTFRGVITGETFIDTTVERGKNYHYTYEAEISPNVYGPRSRARDVYVYTCEDDPYTCR
jgi:hypothetical protein